MYELNGYEFKEDDFNVAEEPFEKTNGFLKVSRSLKGSWIFGNKKATDLHAWIYLVHAAAYKPSTIRNGRELVSLNVGQLITSQDKLAFDWKWGRGSVRTFLDLLQDDNKIVIETSQKWTKITICELVNYNNSEPALNQRQTNTVSRTHEKSLKVDTQKSANLTETIPVNYNNSEPALNQRQTSAEPAANQRQTILEEGKKERIKDNIPSAQKPRPSDKMPEKNKENVAVVARVISLMNSVLGSKFKPNTAVNQRFVLARIKDGFSEEDLNKVVVSQHKLWGQDEKMRQYLRPETLFGNKFEGYLNAVPAKVLIRPPAPNFKNCDGEEDYRIRMEEYNRKYPQ